MSVRIFPYLLLCLGGLILKNALSMTDSPFQTLGAASYARGMAVLCMACALFFILQDWTACLRLRLRPRLDLPAIKHAPTVTAVSALLCLYVLGIGSLGYAVSTFCFLLLSMRLLALSGGKMRIIIPTALCTAVVMYYGMRFFNALLPQTPLY